MSDAAESTPRPSAAERIAAKRAAKAAEKAARRGTDLVPGRAGSLWSRITEQAGAHRRGLTTGVGAIVMVSAAGIGGAIFFEQRAHASGETLWAAIETANARIVAEGDTKPEDVTRETFPTEKARAEAALDRYGKAAAAPGGESNPWVALGRATTLLELGKHDEARKAFARARELAGDDAFVEARAVEGLGAAFEAQGEVDKASEHYQALSTVGGGRERLLGDYHRARLLRDKDKKKEALELLDTALGAEGEKGATSKRAASVREAARALRDEIAVALDLPTLPPEGAPAAAMGGASAETQKLIEQLEKQLGTKVTAVPEPSE